MTKAQKRGSRNEPKAEPHARKQPAFVPGKLVIKFKPGALRGAAAASPRATRTARSARAERDALPAEVADPLAMLRRECGIRRITPLLVPAEHARRVARHPASARTVATLAASVKDTPRESLAGYTMVELDERGEVSSDVLKRMRSSDAIEHVERVANRWTSAKAAKADPEQNLQWGLRAIDWFRVQKRPDARNVHVAILDTGVDDTHPDLAGVIATYDRAGHSRKDIPGHGTHVAGILAARANNGIGISGVANCRLHVWKIFSDPRNPDHEEEFDDEAYNRALAAVLDSPARIVNLSLGGVERSRIEQDLIEALVAEGVLVIAAMGNEFEEGNPTEWPAAYANVLAVGAIGENRRRASFSNTGAHINVVAPGNNILSTLPNYKYFGRDEVGYAAWPGTSMAAPHVAGVAALLKAKYAQKSGTWIGQRLERTAIKLPAMRSKFSRAYGHGLVSLKRAL